MTAEYELPCKSFYLGFCQYRYISSRARRKSRLSASRSSTTSSKLEPTKPASKKKNKDYSHSNRVRRKRIGYYSKNHILQSALSRLLWGWVPVPLSSIAFPPSSS